MMRYRESRRRAVQVLQMVGTDIPPVDVHRIAAELDFDVIPFDFPETVSGVTFIEQGVKSIGVNQLHASTRQRFSIAHELGHYLHGHEAYDRSRIHIEEGRGLLSSHDRQEQEANEFAAELLMPRFLLGMDITGSDLDVALLAKRYQVSEQAMWIQLFDHRLVPDSTR